MTSETQTTKKALCIKELGDVVKVLTGESETFNAQLVSRDICEKPENKFLQLVPYVVFYYTNLDDGRIKVVQYLRAPGINEDRLLAKTSVGFGGHIDSEEDIKASVIEQEEDGTVTYVMSRDDLMATLTKVAQRELMEELSLDLEKAFGIQLDMEKIIFFMGDQNEDVNKVHLGVLIPVELNKEQFGNFFKVVEPNKEEVDAIDIMGIRLNEIVEDMDLTLTIEKIKRKLKHENNLEDWSQFAVEYLIRKEIASMMEPITYNDLLNLSRQLKAQEEGKKATIQ